MEEAKKFLKSKGWEKDSRGGFDFNGLASTLEEFAKDLKHHKNTTVGLWATDRPDLISDSQKVMFQIKEQLIFILSNILQIWFGGFSEGKIDK